MTGSTTPPAPPPGPTQAPTQIPTQTLTGGDLDRDGNETGMSDRSRLSDDGAAIPDDQFAEELAATTGELDPAPAVAFRDRPWTLWAGIAGAIALGGIVFTSLLSAQASRNAAGQFAQVVDPDTVDPSRVEAADAPVLFPPSPPPPYVPGLAPVTPAPGGDGSSGLPSFAPSSPPPPPPPPPSVNPSPPQPYIPPYVPPPPPPPPRPPESGVSEPAPPPPPPPPTAVPGVGANADQRTRSPTLVLDLTGPAPATNPDGTPVDPAAAAAAAGAGPAAASRDPARARRLTNPASTIPQGALIAAVLETGINSDLPGFVRAVVSRDVRSFDGTRILIPRGSRLVGEYTADVALGQSRALVVWNRVIRPDGVSIQITSPGTDTVGRAGLSGRVDRHLWQRYGPGVLLTTINAALSGSSSSTQVVLGSATAAAPQPESIKPTVTVDPGTAIQVFVARDLDFTGVTR